MINGTGIVLADIGFENMFKKLLFECKSPLLRR